MPVPFHDPRHLRRHSCHAFNLVFLHGVCQPHLGTQLGVKNMLYLETSDVGEPGGEKSGKEDQR